MKSALLAGACVALACSLVFLATRPRPALKTPPEKRPIEADFGPEIADLRDALERLERRLEAHERFASESSKADARRPAAEEGRLLDARFEELRVEIERLSRRLAALESQRSLPTAFLPGSGFASTKRSWGPEQATGPPDTPTAGDHPTAWASATPDGEDEWLILEYAEEVVPAALHVYESFNPGALVRASAFTSEGREEHLWAGPDPTPLGSGSGTSVVLLQTKVRTRKVKLYFGSMIVPGWNEIDAVGLVDSKGRIQWAIAAEASTTYADRAGTIRFDAAPR